MTNDRAVTLPNVAPSLPGVLVVQDESDVKEGGGGLGFLGFFSHLFGLCRRRKRSHLYKLITNLPWQPCAAQKVSCRANVEAAAAAAPRSMFADKGGGKSH